MKIYQILAILLLVTGCDVAKGDKAQEDHDMHQHEMTGQDNSGNAKKPLSPRKQAMANIGDVHVHIDYSSPSKRGRTIWNGLVAYGQVWVTGAHTATSIDFSQNVIIDGQEIPAGKYAFFTIPDSTEWTLILNENYDQHLADDYDAKEDIIRVKVKPEAMDEAVESLTYEVATTDQDAGYILVKWDEIQVRLPLAVK